MVSKNRFKNWFLANYLLTNWTNTSSYSKNCCSDRRCRCYSDYLGRSIKSFSRIVSWTTRFTNSNYILIFRSIYNISCSTNFVCTSPSINSFLLSNFKWKSIVVVIPVTAHSFKALSMRLSAASLSLPQTINFPIRES